VDVTALSGDGSITSPNGTVTLTGTPANSLLENVGLDVNESALADGSVTSPNSTITLTGTPANSLFEDIGLDVDITALSGDGSITSPNGTVTLTGTPANSILEDVGFDVDVTALSGDGSITSPNGTVTLTGTPANSLLENVGFDVDVTALSGDGSITSPNSTITLTGTPANSLLENVGLDVDVTALSGDGSITSPNGTVTLGGTPANSILEDVTLDVDVTALSGDGSITSPNGTVTLTGTPANSLLENVGLEVNISADADNDLGIGTDNGLFINETDDQIASEVDITDSGGNFTATNVEGALEELANNSTSIYTDNGTLTGTRTVNGDSNSLIFSGIDNYQIAADGILAISTGLTEIISLNDDVRISAFSEIQLQGDTRVWGNLRVNGSYLDSSGDAGASGQILSSTGTLTNWIDAPTSDDDVSVTNIISGNRIATISETGITDVDINETITVLEDNLDGTFTYNSEDTTQTTFTGTDDQNAGEVNLVTPVDMDEGAEAAPTNETTVEAALQAIAPITSKAARIFYPPSIAIDASALTNNATIDLYQEYIDQFGTPTMASAGAPAAVPTYTNTELYYYVTYADPAVLNIDSISATGVMQYDVVGTPPDYNSLINVVFVVR
jgi:hypothetical protein